MPWCIDEHLGPDSVNQKILQSDDLKSQNISIENTLHYDYLWEWTHHTDKNDSWYHLLLSQIPHTEN